MMTVIAAVLLLVLASCQASAKYLQQLQHYHPVKEPYAIESGMDSTDGDLSGMLARLADKLRPTGDADGPGGWDSVPDPRMYVLTQLEAQQSHPTTYQMENGYADEARVKRRGPSLSIVNPLEVLQEKWLITLNRKQKEQIQNNRELFSKLGKRTGLHGFRSAGDAATFNELIPRFWAPGPPDQ